MKLKRLISVFCIIVLLINCFAFVDTKTVSAEEQTFTYESICENGWEYAMDESYSSVRSFEGGTSFNDYPTFEYNVSLPSLMLPPNNDYGQVDEWLESNARTTARSKLSVKSPVFNVEKSGTHTISFKQSLNTSYNIKFCVLNRTGNILYESNSVEIDPDNPPEFRCDLTLNAGESIQLCSYIDGGSGKYVSQVLYAHVSKPITINCNANGGEGTMNPIVTKSGITCTLPNCAFTAPIGMQFKEWAIGSESSDIRKNAGETYIFNDDTNIYAIWEEIPDYTIQASVSELNLGIRNFGYLSLPDKKTVTITNKGNQTVSLSKNTLTYFDVSDFTKTTLAPNESSTFTVQPKINLGVATYNESLSVCTGNNTGVTISVAFKVNASLNAIINPTNPEIKDGDSQTLTANVVGGSGSYAYRWYVGNSNEVYATTNSIIVSPSNTTTYKLIVDDGIDQTEVTNTVTVKKVVSFDANGGSGNISAIICLEGETITLPTCTMTGPDGLLFKTWAIGSPTSITKINAGETYTVTKSIKIYAVWYDGLIWSDEFNGTALDETVWNYQLGSENGGWGNSEAQYYTKENLKVADGSLQISAKKEYKNGYNYTSSRINTMGKVTAKYGLIEARIKVENGNQNGVWPAFWMMGYDYSSVGWPYCGEVDIMEHANSNAYVGGYLHWYHYAGNSQADYGSGGEGNTNSYGYFTDNVNNGINGWHIYGVIMDESHFEWQLDGKTFLSVPINDSLARCFKKDQFFLLNLAIGSYRTGFTGGKTPPSDYQTATMYVDYVRVYKLGSKGSVGAPLLAPETTKKTSGASLSPANPSVSSENQPETVTYTTVEEVDAILQSNQLFTTYAGIGWAGSEIKTTIPSVTGVEIEVENAGESLAGLQAHAQDLQVTSGNTYQFQTTLESDIDKDVLIEINGYPSEEKSISSLRTQKLQAAIRAFEYQNNESEEVEEETEQIDKNKFYKRMVSLKAGEPYLIDEEVTIPEDFNGTVDIDYSFGKDTDEELSSSTFTLKIENTSLKTIDTVVHSEVVPTEKKDVTTKQEVTKKQNKVNQIISRVTIKSAVKKKSAKKTKITLSKQLKNISGYELSFYQTKKNAKANKKRVVKLIYKKEKKSFTVSHKKLKGKNTLYLCIRAYAKVNNKVIYGKWSNAKKVTIKK